MALLPSWIQSPAKGSGVCNEQETVTMLLERTCCLV